MEGVGVERMLELTARSKCFRELMRDLFAGAQEYSDLRERVQRSLSRIGGEMVVSMFWQPSRTLFPQRSRE